MCALTRDIVARRDASALYVMAIPGCIPLCSGFDDQPRVRFAARAESRRRRDYGGHERATSRDGNHSMCGAYLTAVGCVYERGHGRSVGFR